MKKLLFSGSGVAIVTPMNGGGINYDVLGNLIEFQIENGTDAIISCGTTGESSTLSPEERKSIIKYTVDKVNRRVPVIAGSGSNDTKHALELSKQAEDLGADGLLIVTPYYNKASQQGLIKHYYYIADKVNTPIIVYNVPSRTGCNILPETYLELSNHENICATKEANGNISSAIKTFSLCGDNLHIYSGNDDQIVPMMSVGAKGVISVFANVCPKECHQMTSSFLSGDIKSSLSLQVEFFDLIETLFSDINPIPVKEALNLMGFDCGKCRLPLSDMQSTLKENLKNILLKHKVI
ncbi:MAG: 4-hydroxy-tetrahydrodipicolinate synthase [Oscillospiraceae bacterium]|nr:4-hydroxy-tetrahydrodipicolinate synthase [Oscillospiraceae bacterium]